MKGKNLLLTPSRSTRRFAAAALGVMLVVACSSNRAKGPEGIASHLDAMRSAVTKHVADPQRRAGLLQSIDGLQDDLLTLLS